VTEIIVGAVVALVAVLAAYFKGKSTERQTTKVKEAQSRAELFERVKDADVGNDSGGDDVEWLRNRGK
tara:strand:- start:33937 stop:34140 length:204 start_codon:yes stop_codon:yes gene_type:complete